MLFFYLFLFAGKKDTKEQIEDGPRFRPQTIPNLLKKPFIKIQKMLKKNRPFSFATKQTTWDGVPDIWLELWMAYLPFFLPGLMVRKELIG